MSTQERIRKLVTIQLAGDFQSIDALTDQLQRRTAVPAICTTCRIDDLEPHERAGRCPDCETNTMISLPVRRTTLGG